MTVWQACADCGNDWCNIHGKHAADCHCRELDQWDCDPAETLLEDYANAIRVFTGDGRVADPLSANERHTYTHEGNNFRLHNCVGVPDKNGAMRVRRLTVRECERAQGLPDDYTAIEYRGLPAADGPRYKSIGNSMAVPVMRWIGERINRLA